MPLFLLGAVPCLVAREGAPQRITLSVRDADWKDVLRAALEHTDLNLSFDPGMDTRVQGLELKGVTLEELLEEILPSYGLACVRKGRSLHIVKSDGGLRFYQVDVLSHRRLGTKEFSVNASGQVIQSSSGGGGGGQGGGGGSSQGGGGGQGGSGNSSAYASSLTTGNGSDPWRELELGLKTLVFGDAPAASLAPQQQTSPKGPGGPVPASYQRDGKVLLVNPDSGVVTVAADAATHRKVERYLAETQRRSRRQIVLEAKIVEVTLGADSQMGVDWNATLSAGSNTGGVGTNIIGSLASGATLTSNVASSAGLAQLVVQNARITATLSALASIGKLQVLSSPRISTLNNQKAILRVVREEAFFLMSSQTTGAGSLTGSTTTVNITPMVVPVGIVLDIMPQISDSGGITLAVNPSVSEIVEVRSFGDKTIGAQANLPVVDRRDLDTVVHMQSGETLVLAGIIKDKLTDQNKGVPWLDRIPFLGALFSKREKSKSHTELAIFITATLVEDSQQIESQRRQTTDRLDKAGAELDPKPVKNPPLSTP
jgi:MSHA biogenesis protein MshL